MAAGPGRGFWPLAVDAAAVDVVCRMVHETDIVELDLKGKGFQLSLKKKEALEQLEPQVQQPCSHPPASVQCPCITTISGSTGQFAVKAPVCGHSTWASKWLSLQ